MIYVLTFFMTMVSSAVIVGTAVFVYWASQEAKAKRWGRFLLCTFIALMIALTGVAGWYVTLSWNLHH